MPAKQNAQHSEANSSRKKLSAIPVEPAGEAQLFPSAERTARDLQAMTPREVMHLQRAIGNRATGHLLSTGIQRQSTSTPQPNQTGMTDQLKTGMEQLSGFDMSDVRVHYNSTAPGEVGALAYAHGSDIHLAPGQEQHLPHEAWHVIQQKQRRVAETTQFKGMPGNDDAALEREADQQGRKAASFTHQHQQLPPAPLREGTPQKVMLQRVEGKLKRIDKGKWQIIDSTDDTKVYNIANSALLDALWEVRKVSEGDSREFKANFPKQGVAYITYTEQEKEYINNQKSEESSVDIAKKKFNGLVDDYTGVLSQYPLVGMCEKLISENDGWKYGSMLPYCVLLHFNAEAIFSIFNSLDPQDHLDHLYALQTYVVESWKMGGTLYENPKQYIGKPGDLKNYLQAGMMNLTEILPSLDPKGQLRFLRKVIDSQKGYSWIIPDIQDWMIESTTDQQTVRPANEILEPYLAKSVNMNPFTLDSSKGASSIGGLLKDEYNGYLIEAKKRVWENIFTILKDGAKIDEPQQLGSYLENQQNQIVSSLEKYVSRPDAQEIAKGCFDQINAYAKWYIEHQKEMSNK